MATQPQGGDFCLECHWEAFHIDGKDAVNPSENRTQQQWNCPEHEHQTSLAHCDVDEACCDVDDCPLDCGSICDGFVECDASTVCSATHCDDNNCDDNHCDDNHCDDNHCDDHHCESIDPVCFDAHCCDGTEGQDCGFDSLFGLNTPLSLDPSAILPSTAMAQHGVGSPQKVPEPTFPGTLDPNHHHDFLSSYHAHAHHCEQNVSNHFECHDFQKDMQGMFVNPPFPPQTEVNPAEVFHMLGMCSDFAICQDQHVSNPQDSTTPIQTPKTDSSSALSCFHPEHHHVHGHFKNPNDLNLHGFKRGPHRNHHRCRVHTHAHSHPYSPYSRNSRSSVSSHLISSPGETPPPLEGGASSVLTTPDFSEDSDLHICKWTMKVHGIKAACGATFADAGGLQDHLITHHMTTVDGAKGNGYYCCWEGCHRPDEPFSQKSKLQGHFLTHSNYKNFKCSVCGKTFARQATLDRHERSHRGDKPYKCKMCGKSFTDSSELKTHSRTHSGEKPFKCNYPGCNFETGDSSNMSSHRLTHGERKHKCYFLGCTKSFTRPDQLKRHIKTTHKQEPPSTLPSPSPDHFALPAFAVV
ncbi:Zinc finger protein [Penicillium alfredii]|uniref:Zinc finger protein n=1 Tax=Penicillium alfredii TaxID=1506179 RepID=A0A9W9ERC4_9EURO|nr:Zinc finger protein [Penicillium alfredii]KAJ5086456.1 Zinc finger protein [Penicillium alfredii]